MYADASFSLIADKYVAALLSSMDVDAEQATSIQTLVRSEADRADSGLAVAYHIGNLTVIRADPALAADIAPLATPTKALTSDRFEQWAMARNWRFIDGGDHHVIDRAGLHMRPLPSAAHLRELDREDLGDRILVAALLAANDPDDVDEAEFAMDDLDPFILGLIDATGALRVIVSGRVCDDDNDFDDIGVLTDEQLRGQGWGSAAVSAFCVASFKRGRLPLYRCAWSRTASKALAMSLGFKLVGQVSAVGP